MAVDAFMAVVEYLGSDAVGAAAVDAAGTAATDAAVGAAADATIGATIADAAGTAGLDAAGTAAAEQGATSIAVDAAATDAAAADATQAAALSDSASGATFNAAQDSQLANAQLGIDATSASMSTKDVLTATQLALSGTSLLTQATSSKPSLGTATSPGNAPGSSTVTGAPSQSASSASAALGLPGAGGNGSGGTPGVAQTLLTGAGGVDPNSLNLGKNTLLGS